MYISINTKYHPVIKDMATFSLKETKSKPKHSAYKTLADIKTILDKNMKVLLSVNMEPVRNKDGDWLFGKTDSTQLAPETFKVFAKLATEEIYQGYEEACKKQAAKGKLARLGMWIVSKWPWSEKNYVASLHKSIMKQLKNVDVSEGISLKDRVKEMVG